MSGATLPSDRALALPGSGAADFVFHRRGGRTVLGHLFQRAPLRVLLPRTCEPDVPVAVLLNTSGGLVGGDEMSVRVRLAPGAAAVVTGQAAEKVYRSTGRDCRMRVDLVAEDEAWLEYLPQETILFEGARLQRTTALDVAPPARVMAGEMLVFGRSASGEVLTRGRIRDVWEVWRRGCLLWSDALLLDGDLARLSAAQACLDGVAAIATFVYAAPDAEARLPLARQLTDLPVVEDVRCGVTVVGEVMVARWLGADARRLRGAFGTFWAAFRHQVGGKTHALPQLWHL